MIFFVTGVPLYSRQRPPFYRERAGGLYRAGAYSAATLIAEIPWAFLGALIFQAVFMPLVGLRSTPDAFFWQTLAHFMTFVFYLWFAQMAVALLPSEAIAQVRASCDHRLAECRSNREFAIQMLGILFFVIQLLFSGLLPPVAAVRAGWMWLTNVVAVAWPVRFILITQVRL